MDIKQFFLVFCGFCAVCALSSPAQASEKLVYNQGVSRSSKLLIKKFLNSDLKSIQIARADLNDDGLYEFVIKPSSCVQTSELCQFRIVAESNDEIISLGTIGANFVAIDDQYSSGIRNVKAFDNPLNDFSYSLYIWEPKSSRYMLEE